MAKQLMFLSIMLEYRIEELLKTRRLKFTSLFYYFQFEIENYRQVMEVNFFGIVSVTKALLSFVPDTGCVIVTSSMQGKISIPYRSCYAASKHALQVILLIFLYYFLYILGILRRSQSRNPSQSTHPGCECRLHEYGLRQPCFGCARTGCRSRR